MSMPFHAPWPVPSCRPRALALVPSLKAAALAVAMPLVMALGAGPVHGAPQDPSPVAAPPPSPSALPAPTPSAAGGGWAVPIGGALKDDHDALWQRLVALAGGPGSRWVVLGTASGSPMSSAEAAAVQLRRRGAVAEVLPVSPLLDRPAVADAVRDPALVAQVRAARGVYFTGGSQDRIVDHLAPGGVDSPLLAAIRGVQAAGGVVAGTSAGAAVMSTTMFRDAPSVMAVLKGRLRDGAEVGRGLGFVGPGLFVDQHFFRRGRIGRLLPAMVATGTELGVGVEENSAVAVHAGELEVIGGTALIVDLRDAQARGPMVTPSGAAGPAADATPLQVAGARLSLLGAGDRIHLRTRVLTPAPARARGQRMEPGTPGYKPYYTLQPFHADFLGEGVLPTVMGLLIDATYDEVRGLAFDPRAADAEPLAALGFEFRLYKAPGTLGWYTEEGGGETYTVHRMGLDVRALRMARPLYSPWLP
jgi:cyanophycinase